MEINYLDQPGGSSHRVTLDLDKVTHMQCLICDKQFTLKAELDDYLGHLFLVHRLVIADVQDISLIEEYLQFWQEKLSEETLPSYCTTMLLNQKPDGTPSQDEKYFLLSDIISEDSLLRQDLKKKLLKIVVDQHQFELTDKNFHRGCIFCRDVIGPMRSDFIDHLYNKHFLLLGKSEKLVFVDHLFARLEKQMEDLICIFCEKVFYDRTALKDHMRKKGHKMINPDIKSYDQYFLINYYKDHKAARRTKRQSQCPRKPPPSQQQEVDDDFPQDSDSDWSDWKEDEGQGNSETVTCLFCVGKHKSYEELKAHLLKDHEFNLEDVLLPRNFYERIKIINFIRRQMLNNRCISCEKKHEDFASLQKHLKEEKHCVVPEKDRWNQPEYFFPTFEDDSLLYFIESGAGNGEEEADLEAVDPKNDSVEIFSEDNTMQINKDAEELSLERFKLED